MSEQIADFLLGVSLPDDWADGMLERLSGEQEKLRKAVLSKQAAMETKREALAAKADRAQEGWLDGVLPLAEYRAIRNRIVEERREIDEAMAELEHRAGNRFEPVARFLKASKQAKKWLRRAPPKTGSTFSEKSVRTHNWYPAT